MSVVSNYEIFDMLNRMSKAQEFLDHKEEIQELLDKISVVQLYLQKFGSLTELIKHLKYVEDMMFVCKDMFTPEEAAKFMGISKSHMYRITSKNGITKYSPTGKLIYIAKEDLIDYMKQNEIISNEELDRLSRLKVDEYEKECKNRKFNKL